MDMSNFLRKLKLIPIDKARKKETLDAASKKALELFRSLSGSLLWLGAVVIPQAS